MMQLVCGSLLGCLTHFAGQPVGPGQQQQQHDPEAGREVQAGGPAGAGGGLDVPPGGDVVPLPLLLHDIPEAGPQLNAPGYGPAGLGVQGLPRRVAREQTLSLPPLSNPPGPVMALSCGVGPGCSLPVGPAGDYAASAPPGGKPGHSGSDH